MHNVRHFLRHRAVAITVAIGIGSSLALSTANATDNAAQTKYPIVLVHGATGFSSVMGVDYYYRIPAALRQSGATVYVASLSALNSSDVRGEQLLKQLKQWAAATGQSKFNLISHSQGGLDARYVQGVAPEMVVSVMTIATPHFFTPKQAQFLPLLNVVAKPMDGWGNLVAGLSGNSGLPQDTYGLTNMAEDLDTFNARFPAGKPAQQCGDGAEKVGNTYFYSVTGNRPSTNILDPLDLPTTAANLAMYKPDNLPSDGLVSVCAAHWGKMLRADYPWNHFDEINQFLGALGWNAPDPIAFYLQYASRLKTMGL
jgi:triacylglycerol lipase